MTKREMELEINFRAAKQLVEHGVIFTISQGHNLSFGSVREIPKSLLTAAKTLIGWYNSYYRETTEHEIFLTKLLEFQSERLKILDALLKFGDDAND